MQPGCEQRVGRARATNGGQKVGQCVSLRQSSSTSAFTLVELLVVIGIISVLISILLPVLHKVREQANTVVCASNQRQILQSMFLYSADNKGWLPRPVGNDLIGKEFYKRYSYSAILMDDVSHYDYVTPGALLRYISRDVQIRERIFSCPSDGPERYGPGGWTLAGGPPGPNFKKPRNFSYNFNTSSARGVAKINQIHHPANKVLVVEEEYPYGSTASISGIGMPDATGRYLYVLLSTRHSGYCNEGFADGHVELFDKGAIDTPSADGRTNRSGTDGFVHYFMLDMDQ